LYYSRTLGSTSLSILQSRDNEKKKNPKQLQRGAKDNANLIRIQNKQWKFLTGTASLNVEVHTDRYIIGIDRYRRYTDGVPHFRRMDIL